MIEIDIGVKQNRIKQTKTVKKNNNLIRKVSKEMETDITKNTTQKTKMNRNIIKMEIKNIKIMIIETIGIEADNIEIKCKKIMIIFLKVRIKMNGEEKEVMNWII